MAFVMSSVDLYYVTKELVAVLKDAKVDQVYHPDQLTLRIRFYCPGKGKREIVFAAPQAIYEGADVSIPGEHDGFCAYLRKNIAGLRVLEVKQEGFNRILSLSIGKDQELYKLIFEFFDKGNILLTEAGNIKSVAQVQNWTNRQLKAHEAYTVPQNTFPHTYSLEAWTALIHKSFQAEPTLTLSKFLATHVSLGGIYASVVCSDAQMDSSLSLATISDEQAQTLLEVTKKIFDREIKPVSIIDESTKQVLHVSANTNLVPQKFSASSKLEIPSILNGYASIFGVATVAAYKKEMSKAQDTARKKAQTIVDSQTAQLTTFDKERDQMQAIGEHIYGDYQQIEQILTQSKSFIESHSQSEVKEKLPITVGSYQITAVDFAAKKITVKHVS